MALPLYRYFLLFLALKAQLAAAYNRHDALTAAYVNWWGKNNTAYQQGTQMLTMSSGTWSYFRNNDAGALAVYMDAIWSNKKFRTEKSIQQQWAGSIASSLQTYVKGVNRIVNNKVGGTGYNESLFEFACSMDAISRAFEMVDKYGKEFNLGVTNKDRSDTLKAWRSIFQYLIDYKGYANFTDGSFNHIVFAGAAKAIAVAARQVAAHQGQIGMTAAEIKHYEKWVGQYLTGAWHFPSNPSSFPETFLIASGKYGVAGALGVIEPSWTGQTTRAFTGKKTLGTSSDSTGYGTGDLVNILSGFHLLAGSSPYTINNSSKTIQQLADWIESYAKLIMGYGGPNRGFIPNYGDSTWDNGVQNTWAVLEMTVPLIKHSNSVQAERLKAWASMFRNYAVSQSGGALVMDPGQMILLYMDDSVKPAAQLTAKSWIKTRMAPWGEEVPDKVVLRGKANSIGEQPFAMIQAYAHTEGHGHGGPSNLIVHGYKSNVMVRNLGYASNADILQNIFLVRRASQHFLNYQNLKGTQGQTSPVQPYGWSDSDIPSDKRIPIDASQQDFDRIAYARVKSEYITGSFGDSLNDTYSYRRFSHVREIALDRSTGALFIYDVIFPRNDTPNNVLSYGQLYHVSEVFKNTTNGIIAQEGGYYQNLGTGLKGLPFVLQMAGPTGTKVNNQWWHFKPAMSTLEWSQNYHVYSRWVGSLKAGRKIGFLTAVVPYGNRTQVDAHSLGDVPIVKTVVASDATATASAHGVTVYFGPRQGYDFSFIVGGKISGIKS